MKKSKSRNYGLPVLILLIFILAGVICNAVIMVVQNTERVDVPQSTDASAPRCDFTKPWYEQYMIVTHALGNVDGRSETNSREAFIENYNKGARVFEADMSLTADGYLVIRHDFTSTSFWNLEQTMDENMYYADYMNAKIGYFYTPLDIDGLFALMREYPDTYLVTDTKLKDEDGVKETFRRLNEGIERADDPTLRSRIIVQVYDFDMYDYIKDSVSGENCIFTLYQLGYDRDFEKVADYCGEKGIPVVTMDVSLADEESLAFFKDKGIKVYVNTLNKISKMTAAVGNLGVDGFYSDYITDSQLKNVLGTHGTSREDDISYGEY